MQRKKFAKIILIFFMFVLGLEGLHSQESKIMGIIRDAEGARLAGVAVSINNSDVRTITNAYGEYTLVTATKGKVVVLAYLEGFELAMKPVVVKEGETATVNFNFDIGDVNVSTGISVFNVYNHKNIWRKEFDIVDDELIATDVTYLGITPSLFLKIRF